MGGLIHWLLIAILSLLRLSRPVRQHSHHPHRLPQVQESTLNEVVLTVDHRASGILRCELLATTFEQDTKQDNMTVVGDLLLLNCSSPFSYPPTALTWDINGLQAGGPREIVVTYPGEWDGEGRVSAWSGLHMWLRAHHFREGVLVLRCTASILHVYRVSTELIITDGNYMQTSPREGASTGGQWPLAHG
ncbi:hypothetical protein Hamer_G023612 [Homarus americanus]|uniref:Uncharacterized protein n=1 Tax=Homarus americanus TaxID=6706 RepID=A0A8J5JL97_HOMAM|nr:hypothetical protein Hamer_G023612 [Homarus americanus]